MVEADNGLDGPPRAWLDEVTGNGEHPLRVFEAMIETSPDSYLVLDDRRAIRFASAGIERLLGLPPGEAEGRTPLDFVHPEDRATTEAGVERLVTTGETVQRLLRLLHRDGRVVWAEVFGTNQLDRPEVRGLVVNLRDVTERVEEEQRMRRLLSDSTSIAFVVDPDLRVTWMSPGTESFFSLGRRLRAEQVRDLFKVGSGTDPVAAFEEILAGGPGASHRLVGRFGAGHDGRWLDVTLHNALDDAGIEGVIVKVRDVDDAVRASEAGHQLSQVLGSTTDMVCIYDPEGNLIWANPTANAVFGAPPITADEARVRTPAWARVVIEREVRPALRDVGSWRGELAVLTEDGELPIESSILLHRSRDGMVGFTSIISRDISQRKELETQLHTKARTDTLTGLPNRAVLTERLDQLLADPDSGIAVAFIDLDQFKTVNDTQGHDAGDQLLVAAAERLRLSVRNVDLVARFGGDEFVVVLVEIDGMDDARARVERILADLRGSVRAGTINVFITASAGVALADSASEAAELISNADAAMYVAKKAGRDQVAVFTDELRARSVQRLETAHDLRSVLDTEAIEVWYQPIVSTTDRRPIAMEGLVRWRHPELGLLSPARFIPIAEETGLIIPLGATVIRQACAALAVLGDAGAACALSVNVSPYQLADPDLISTFRTCMEEHAVAAGRVTCELTEDAVMQDTTLSAQTLEQIRALGVGIAVDDFGTGYSSLAYLHRFPVDVLKIDREFIQRLTFGMDWQHSLAAGIISMAHSLGLIVIGEGVETEEQADILAQLGCDAMQGFLFDRPMPLEQLPASLERLQHAAGPR